MGRIKSSLSIKIFFGIAAILLAVSFTMFGILRIFMPKVYENELTSQISNNIYNLAKRIETVPKKQWSEILTSFCLDNNAGVTIFDEYGEQVAGISMSVFKVSEDTVTEAGTNTPMATFTAAFEYDGKPYIIVAQLNAGAVEQVTGIFAKVFPYVFIIVIMISALAALLYSRFLAKPIVDITKVSERMTALDMTWQCDVSRSDEIGVLAGNLNEMAEKLYNTLNELHTANEKLRDDIDREREQDKRRRDFFSAISHELKTPITILKGELDGMILNVGKFRDRDKYLQEAYETTESIEKLVREILTISKFNTITLNPDDISLTELVAECCRTYEVMAHDKNININWYYDKDIIIRADKKQIQTVISNIISNAVKHSPESNIVNINILKGNKNIVLSVENTGVQIDKDELPRIWEPFYRTDKSRSRDTGGSGLGLYIVKTILDNHGFEYRFENTDTGMKFTIVFSI